MNLASGYESARSGSRRGPGDKRDERHKIEQNDAKLLGSHASVVDGIESVGRELEPVRMQAIHPVMCEHERPKPDEQNCIVNCNTPKQDRFNFVYSHGYSFLDVAYMENIHVANCE
jgi:hypothetical protein